MVKGATATIHTTPALPKVRVRPGQAPGFTAKLFQGPPKQEPIEIDGSGVVERELDLR